MTYIQKRNVASCVILSFVTFGIYQIYWVVMLAKEAVSVRDRNDSGTLEVLLMLFIPFVGTFLAERKLVEGANAQGIPLSDNSVVYLLIGLFCFNIVSFALMQNDLNHVYDTLTAPGYQPPYGAGYQPPYGYTQPGAGTYQNPQNGYQPPYGQ